MKEVLAWCLPALLAGFIVRATLTKEIPYGYYHADTPDFLTTPDRWLFQHHFELHTNKTFLAPMLFTIPFVLHVPALIVIPLFQHLLGLILVALMGLLCRLWFAHWKWFILPLTFLVALNPALLWYEHTLMAETLFVFCTALVALAGTLYARRHSKARFVLFCATLVLVAGARPEGKLLFGFGMLLVALVDVRDWRIRLSRFVAVLLLGAGTHLVTKTSQAGLLLYTSVSRLTPTALNVAPGFDPYITAERAALQQRWDQKRLFPKVADRRVIGASITQYLADRTSAGFVRNHRSVNDFCQRLAAETCLRQFTQLPALAYWKFRLTSNDPPNGLFDQKWLWDTQVEAYADGGDRSLRLSTGLIGAEISRNEGWHTFVMEHFQNVQWFNTLTACWFETVNSWRLPDTAFDSGSPAQNATIYRGVPLYVLLSGAGLLVTAIRPGSMQRFHIAWGLSLAAFFFVIILTANVKPRFRLAFEPFWFVYVGLLLETSWLVFRHSASRVQHSRGGQHLRT